MSLLTRSNNFSIDELIAFSLQNPWQESLGAADAHRFLSELVSSSEFVFDLHDQHGRVATAALLDKVSNPSNDACLELLGLRKGSPAQLVFEHLLLLAKSQVPLKFSGIQVGLSQQSNDLVPLLLYNDFKLHYEVFDMIHSEIPSVEIIDYKQIRLATRDDAELAYKILCDSFADNIETSIPELTVWKARFLSRSSSSFYFWQEDSKPVAFTHLIVDNVNNSTTVSSIGVHPQYRGKGIGKMLLRYCLSQSRLSNAATCSLTVATTNSKALDLYQGLGFRIDSKAHCYRWPR